MMQARCCATRSEERRVGKEGRTGRARDQAEDGIRDRTVTGVQTCALPICAIHYPIAMDGALKLKEVSYIHAEGYPTGETKHGPNALIDESLPVVIIATCDRNDAGSVLRYEIGRASCRERG